MKSTLLLFECFTNVLLTTLYNEVILCIYCNTWDKIDFYNMNYKQARVRVTVCIVVYGMTWPVQKVLLI